MKKTVAGMMAVAGIAALGVGAQQAKADFIPTLVDPITQAPTSVPTAGPGADYTYTYSVQLTGSETANPGDYFTLYDIGGYVSAGTGLTATTGYWVPSAQTLGETPASVNVADSPQYENVTFTYEGGTSGYGTTTVGPATFTGFTIVSTVPVTGIGSYATYATNTALSPLKDGNSGPVRVPLATPEPGAIASFGFGGFGLLGLMVRSRRRNATAL